MKLPPQIKQATLLKCSTQKTRKIFWPASVPRETFITLTKSFWVPVWVLIIVFRVYSQDTAKLPPLLTFFQVTTQT